MTVAAALAEMRARGVFIFLGEDVDDGRPVVRWRAAPGIVTERTVRYIRTHKEELIALLQAEAAADADRLRLAAARAFFDGESDDDAADAVPAAIAEADDAEPEQANWLGAQARALALEDAAADAVAVPEALQSDIGNLLQLPDDVFAEWKREVERDQPEDEPLARDRQAVALAERLRAAYLVRNR
jgi:hypothetical protein